MKKHHILRTILFSTVFALLALVLLTPVARAHTAASIQRAATATSQIPAIPNVNIVRKHGRSVFSVTTVHCKARGLSTDKPCFTITNTTDKDQQVIFKGRVIITIPPGAVANMSISSAGLGFVGLHANPHAILLVIAS
jgi:hypothetical protein